MAKLAPSYIDNFGQVHPSAEAAVISDIAAVLGRLSADAGIAGGVAKMIVEKRPEIEAAYRDLDAMLKVPPAMRMRGVAS